VSGILRRFLRCRAFRHEGGVSRDGARTPATELSQLVPSAVSVRLCDVSMRGFVAMKDGAPPIAHALPDIHAADLVDFAADVRYYLSLDPRQLPSRYLYDALGSALFEAICWLPWYRITRAEERLLA